MHNKKWDLRIICAHAFTILIWGARRSRVSNTEV